MKAVLTKDDVCDVVRGPSDIDRLDEQPSRGKLGDKREAHRAEGELITDLPAEQKPSDGPERRSRADETDTADDPENDVHGEASV